MQIADASNGGKGFKHNGSASIYTYDANGNLISDSQKGITNIEYNYLNLPTKIIFTGNRSINFIYDATGKKWRKSIINNGVETSYRDYIGDAEYLNGGQDIIHFTEGYAKRDISTDGDGVWNGWVYKYTLKDHLGNTRVTYSDKNKDGLVSTADIEQVNHYYAFGMNMEGPWNGADGSYKYGFNGKEWNDDFGLGWNHHDWRFLDVAIDRFVTIDRLPEEEDQEQLSPYHFAHDNPIRYDDPDGQCPTCPAAAAGAVIGGVLGGLIEAGSQLYHDGKISDLSAVGGAMVQGAITGGLAGLTAGSSLLTTTAVAGVANGIGGAANKAIQGKEITAGSVAKDVAIGATFGAVGHVAGKYVAAGLDKLSNAAKGKLGEAVTQVKYAAQGYKSTGKAVVQTGRSTATGRIQVARYDHAMKNVVTGKQLTVESKFNTSGLTPNQAAASSNVATPGGLIIDKTTSQQLGNTVQGVVTGSSGQIKN